MSARSTGKPDGAGTMKAKAAETAEPKFLIRKLREECITLFGVTSSTFDGAFHGCTEEEMSIEDARARITAWLGKEIK